jgi:hypothetical protein
MENKCAHCGKEFVSKTRQIFCPEHAEMFMAGTIRMCEKCGGTWEVEAGDCGFTTNDEHGFIMELCKGCENELRKEV